MELGLLSINLYLSGVFSLGFYLMFLSVISAGLIDKKVHRRMVIVIVVIAVVFIAITFTILLFLLFKKESGIVIVILLIGGLISVFHKKILSNPKPQSE